MTKYNFIFSNERRHRLARHITFWFLWCLAFNLLFHFPMHVFRGWDFSAPPNRNLRDLGLPLFFVKTFFVNTLFGVVIPQIAFTYVLIYWLLPKFYLKEGHPLIAVAATVAVLLIFYLAAIGFKYSSIIYNRIAGIGTPFPSFNSMHQFVLIDQLTSLPIIAGFALMIKLVKRLWLKHQQAAQLAREKIKAELQLLKAQVHPHFLFNTLNNIYYFILSGSPKAPEMIIKLSGLLHYILNECNQPYVSLEKEMKMIRDYMALENIRYGDQMIMSVELPVNCNDKMIAPLLLIPFIENSFKHGASKMLTQPYVKLNIQVDDDSLLFFIVNSRPGVNESPAVKGNIGLKNVRKRLELLYPSDHELTITTKPDSFAVELKIKLHAATTLPVNIEPTISTNTYVVA